MDEEEYETDASIHERLFNLEAKAKEQEAQIDGLVRSLSDLLAAHAVLHKDVRLFSFLGEYRDYGLAKRDEGGTARIPASYFQAKSEIFARLLDESANSMSVNKFSTDS